MPERTLHREEQLTLKIKGITGATRERGGKERTSDPNPSGAHSLPLPPPRLFSPTSVLCHHELHPFSFLFFIALKIILFKISTSSPPPISLPLRYSPSSSPPPVLRGGRISCPVENPRPSPHHPGLGRKTWDSSCWREDQALGEKPVTAQFLFCIVSCPYHLFIKQRADFNTNFVFQLSHLPHLKFTMSSPNARKNKKIHEFFHQVPKEGQNNSSISQVKGNSRKMPRDTTNTQDQRPLSSKKIQQDQIPPPNKKIIITLDVNRRKNKNMKYDLTHSEKSSLYAALNTLSAVTDEIKNQQGKEMLVCGKEGIEGYINLGMPLCCFPEGCHLVITFSPCKSEPEDNKQLFEPQDHPSNCYVLFYIHAIGSKRRKILKYGELHKKGNKLCVYGLKGESIKDTLRKDGRFLSFVESDDWKLISELDTVIEITQPVDALDGKLFQVEAERTNNPRISSVTQNSELENRSFHKVDEHIVDQYPVLKEQREKLRAYIKEQNDKEKKKTSLFKMHKENFGKLTINSTSVKVLKHLSQASDSVGYLWWNNNGKGGCATCFVFKESYIFTCRHVINDIVGEGVEPSKWASTISRCVKVIFDYEEFPPKEDNAFNVKPWFEISSENLDYAVLELEENGRQVPAGLYNGIGPAPDNGLIYIIGHPDGEKKSTDGCTVVPQYNRGRKCEENVQARKAAGEYVCRSFLSIYTQRSFQQLLGNSDVVTYDTTFFGGSSGSPVFDSNCSLVAMHAAGFVCKYQSGVHNIIELGSTMESIIADIMQNKYWYNKIFGNCQDEEMLNP
ncbi:serine protease FAM111A-like isoform X2 [Microtus pennsylvanicus]|uniref:serine protease FAM111A-like isoform X2 n=1 Tax=Microtus pennsylvanicus TaxID=10058 RepID=UPI003F6A59A2